MSHGETAGAIDGEPVSTNPFDEATPLISPTVSPPPYQATETNASGLRLSNLGFDQERREAPPRYTELFHSTSTSINSVPIPERSPQRNNAVSHQNHSHAGQRRNNGRQTEVTSVTPRPARALVGSASTRTVQRSTSSVVFVGVSRPARTTAARPQHKRNRCKPAVYAALFVVGVLFSAADLFVGVWLKIRNNDDDTNKTVNSDFFLLMGGMEVLFVLWHTSTLLLPFCCRRTTYNKVIHWLLRVFHIGAILLLLLMIEVSLVVWPTLPDLFLWTWPIACLFASMMTKYVTLIYWVVELAVDACKCCLRA